jgi:hypothetical protein
MAPTSKGESLLVFAARVASDPYYKFIESTLSPNLSEFINILKTHQGSLYRSTWIEHHASILSLKQFYKDLKHHYFNPEFYESMRTAYEDIILDNTGQAITQLFRSIL